MQTSAGCLAFSVKMPFEMGLLVSSFLILLFFFSCDYFSFNYSFFSKNNAKLPHITLKINILNRLLDHTDVCARRYVRRCACVRQTGIYAITLCKTSHALNQSIDVFLNKIRL